MSFNLMLEEVLPSDLFSESSDDERLNINEAPEQCDNMSEIDWPMHNIDNNIEEDLQELSDSSTLDEQEDEQEDVQEDEQMLFDASSSDKELEFEIEESKEVKVVETNNYVADSSESKLKKIVSEISDSFSISSDLVLDILIANNFKSDFVSESLMDEGYLKSVKSKQDLLLSCDFEGTIECEICLSEHHASDMFALSCGHSFCFDCWLSNMKTKIESHDIDIVCLHEGCCHRVSSESIRKFVDQDCFCKFMRIVDHQFSVSISNRVVECSNARCRENLTVGIDDQYGDALRCRKCGQFTCIECKERAHFPLKCHEKSDFEMTLPTVDLHINLYCSLVAEHEEAILVFLIMITRIFSPVFLDVMRYRSCISTLIKRRFVPETNIDEVRNCILLFLEEDEKDNKETKEKSNFQIRWFNKIKEFKQLYCLYHNRREMYEVSLNTFLENDNLFNYAFAPDEIEEIDLGDDEPLFRFYDSFLKNEWTNHCNAPILPTRNNDFVRSTRGAYGDKEIKRCPNCGVTIIKDNGCLHMKCKCNHEFCWNCLKPWNFKDHPNYFLCNFDQTKPENTNPPSNEEQEKQTNIGPYQNTNEQIDQFLNTLPLISIHDMKKKLMQKNIRYSLNFLTFTTSGGDILYRSDLFTEKKQLYLCSLLTEREVSTFLSYMKFKEKINSKINKQHKTRPSEMSEYFIEHKEKLKEALESIIHSDSSLYFNKFAKIIENYYYFYYCFELNNMFLIIDDKQSISANNEIDLMDDFINLITSYCLNLSNAKCMIDDIKEMEERIKIFYDSKR